MRSLALSATLAIGLALPVGGAAQAQSGATSRDASVFGRWLTHDGSGIIEIKPCGNAACGRLVKVLDPEAPRNDVNNPDRSLRDRKLLGIRVLSGFKQDGDRWEDGEAYDPQAGRTVRARMSLASPERLVVTGCVLIVCKTKHWTRVGKD